MSGCIISDIGQHGRKFISQPAMCLTEVPRKLYHAEHTTQCIT
jgi:hypothetical protein